eukprot:scpid32425/ scgid7481/ Merlin; Moesin-ezrin-radixin-like protein; Neurofibromin-2; Schwannomerlin; Schwannomin
MPKTFDVRVTTMDAELEFSMPWKSSGQELFDMVTKTIGIREIWFFGLYYTDSKGFPAWLKLNKKVVEQDFPARQNPLQLVFKAKFFPEDVEEELITDITMHLVFLQVKQAILDMEIYCPPEASVLLASYAVQAKYGDYDPAVYPPGFLKNEILLPPRVLDQYQMTADMWEERITSWYSEHVGMLRDEAEMEYLKIAQDLEMYGVNYFPIKNKKGTDLWLGVDALGLNVYEVNDKLTPVISFPWSEIRNIAFKDKKFTIKPTDKKSPDFVFYTQKLRTNKMILQLNIGNHDLYMRRRHEDTMEIQQMKAQAKEERSRKQAERNRLARERAAREEAEREKEELQARLRHFEEEAKKANEMLIQSEERSELLQRKARQAEEEATSIIRKAEEAEEEIRRVREIAVKTEEEKKALEAKAYDAHQLAQQLLRTSDERQKEADALKNELLTARQAEMRAKQQLLSVTAGSTPSSRVAVASDYPRSTAAEAEGSTSSLHAEGDEIAVDLIGDDVDELSKAIEQERLEYIQKSQKLKQQLSELKTEITVLKVSDKQTDEDRLHEENYVQKGETKYSTLSKITSGTTKTRVEFFEQL